MRHWASAIAALLTAGACVGQSDPVRLLVGSHWTAPMAIHDGQRLSGGVFKDFAQALAQESGRRVEIRLLPKARNERAMRAGEIDLVCFSHPGWWEQPQQLVWARRPMHRFSEVVFGHASSAPIRALDELPRGSSIATAHGYRYPAFEPRFADGRLRREDALDEGKVLVKVSLGRNPYGIAKAMAVDWFGANTRDGRLAVWRFELGSTEAFCAVPRASPQSAETLLAIVDRMVDAGLVERLFSRYR